MERENLKRDRTEAELNHDAFDIYSPDHKMRAISETALAFKEPVPLTERDFSMYFKLIP